MNGSARSFHPTTNYPPPTGTANGHYQNNTTPSQVRAPPSSPYLEARLLNLEEEHCSLRSDVNILNELCHSLHDSVNTLKKGGWPVHVGPFQECDAIESHQSALRFKEELDQITNEVCKSHDSDANKKKNGIGVSKHSGSMPSNLKTTSATSNGASPKSVPPHLRGAKKTESKAVNGASGPFSDKTKDKYEPLITDGPIDTSIVERRAPALSPSSSTTTAVQGVVPTKNIENMSLDKDWQPYYLTTLKPLSPDILSKVPSKDMITFHPEFIKNHLGGVIWSPGLRFVDTDGPCILKNRTYYELDPNIDPYLPMAPGGHGAKLTAFFNQSPEETHGDLFAENTNTYENVPMFVEQNNAKGQIRYIYFGNYSQTRWSDKLDYDTLKTKVPQHVKEYHARELTDTVAREEWVTEALKKHFFPKPEYEGRIYAASTDATTHDIEDEVKHNERMIKDVKSYVKSLRDWERDASMKTAHIKKQAILAAFDAADVDDPPALRLWWEYLECVDWNQDFYNLLVTLQSRNKESYFA
ncbi:hypothetical protein P153DRAFT_389952 [Dothidotthia symphoricarpi CBS 119687]|uniref:DUF6697 domain-containing protein n=1 Tax=Dothidotthia symphoricarpi CBS 119687 TaxID=1392245 RepID=A0A6A6A3E0_9PLEO|nr:uncharacterized protein P153DRAFT_389952 [Dothidotthia symphoricarpi CBS 119687]KAF2125101.1 hypothetical protein P153DRAFT_389952 [Dothidotthia symphoricarpi CBS 119687]